MMEAVEKTEEVVEEELKSLEVGTKEEEEEEVVIVRIDD